MIQTQTCHQPKVSPPLNKARQALGGEELLLCPVAQSKNNSGKPAVISAIKYGIKMSKKSEAEIKKTYFSKLGSDE